MVGGIRIHAGTIAVVIELLFGVNQLWVPLALSVAMVSLGVCLGRLLYARRLPLEQSSAWNEGYSIGYLQGMRDEERRSRP